MSEEREVPLVSAVIPTRNRPDLVCRAVRSALNQTYPNLEVVVVVDGPDPATVAALEALHEPRVRIVALSENVGGSEARNIGAREARGKWIAYLDDDDEWFPSKTAIQLNKTLGGNVSANFSACRYVEQNPTLSRTMPRDFPRENEELSEYIYCRGGVLLTSSFIINKSLLMDVSFTKGLPNNQDTDWLLRAGRSGILAPIWVDDVLLTYHNESNNKRISSKAAWRARYRWAEQNRDLLTRNAMPYYIARLCIPDAKKSTMPMRDCIFLLFAAFRIGHLVLSSFIYLLLCIFTSPEVRRKLRLFVERPC